MNFGIILRWMFSMNIKYINSIQATWSQRREKKKTALILNEYNNMATKKNCSFDPYRPFFE